MADLSTELFRFAQRLLASALAVPSGSGGSRRGMSRSRTGKAAGSPPIHSSLFAGNYIRGIAVADVPTRGKLYRLKAGESADDVALAMDPNTESPHYSWGDVVFAAQNWRLYSEGWLNWRVWFEPTWDKDGLINTKRMTGVRATLYIPIHEEVVRFLVPY